MWSTDGSGAWKGLTQDILANAPVGAWAQKPDGNWCLAPTEGATADQITLVILTFSGVNFPILEDAKSNLLLSHCLTQRETMP